MSSAQPTVVVICGPTAVGKTAVAIELAQHFHTQIISADSRQCYRELNIGVAKPSHQQLQEIHHYFINSHSITEDVNAAIFEQYALQSAAAIFKHNNIAVMVGGTGLYIKAFCDGIDEIPQTPAEIRESIINNYNQHGLSWLQSEVQKKDLAYWQSGEQQNPHRLIRALGVVTATGKSINTFKTQTKVERPFNVIKVGLGLPKEELFDRINNRVEQMMEAGLVSEVRSLQDYENLKALQTVGYRELFDYFKNKTSLEQAVELIKTNTRQYAKRQLTWFKKDADIKWFSAEQSPLKEIIKHLDDQ